MHQMHLITPASHSVLVWVSEQAWVCRGRGWTTVKPSVIYACESTPRESCTHFLYRCSSAHFTALSQTSESSTAIISLRPSASFAIMLSALGTATPCGAAYNLQDNFDGDLCCTCIALRCDQIVWSSSTAGVARRRSKRLHIRDSQT